MAYFVGLDLGQSADYTALAVLQTVKEPRGGGNFQTSLHLRHLERYPLRTPYTAIADGVVGVMRSKALTSDEYDPARHRVAKPKVELLVDKTGVGRGVAAGPTEGGQSGVSGPSGPGVCGISYSDFGEHPFHALG